MTRKVKIEIGVLAVLVLAVGTLWYYYRHPATESAQAAAPGEHYKPMGVENPQIHWARLTEAQRTDYKSTGRDIFSRELPPPPPRPVHIPKPGDKDFVKPVEVPPPPPQLPLKFFGYGTVPVGASRRAFLTDGEEVYIVAEGDTLLGRYRIVRINNVNLEFEEISSGRRGSSNLEDQGPTV